MLIRSLRGENFMKFRCIQIDGIPERGLIGIQGNNEGGKSTIGELIQFALFGKTVTTRDGSVMDLIHWDHDHCMVELDFTSVGPHGASSGAGPVETYRIWREVDPKATLETMEFIRMALAVVSTTANSSTNTPSPPLKTMELPAPATMPPMTLLGAKKMRTPFPELPY